MKKLINAPRAVVREMLEGLPDLHPGLALLESENVIVRTGLPSAEHRPVALLSGGGSGHEPAHAGYVGNGMLTAAVAGEVFTSPSVDAVLAGIRAASGPAGAILIVKNYTGDRLNFGLAAELARTDGIPVEVVIVADDVALAGTVANDRRRGIAGTVLVHKIAGAAAAGGRSLAEVAQLARAAAADVGTMGVALGACTVPAAGRPGFELGPDEIELGLGIHGEAGVERAPMMPADALVERLLSSILSDRQLVAGDRVALLVNGLGGTPPMELAIVARHAMAVSRAHGLSVERAWAGTFMSALEMPGVSLSLLRVDDERLALLDAATTAPAWPGPGKVATRAVVAVPSVPQASRRTDGRPADLRLPEALVAVATALEAAEGQLTDLDSRAGDGDLGASMVRAAEALRTLATQPWSDPAPLLAAAADALRRAIGGSSGPFYATGLLRAARRLPSLPTPLDWAQAFEDGVAAIGALGGAQPGDRTMIDALAPAARAVSRQVSDGAPLGDILKAAALAAETGAAATAGMAPRLGRASYLGQRALGIPDAGAAAVVIWLRALADRFA
ncbi:dihydroxyacetone kinase family protein [Reyranella sp.]|uniref:dihydroxyacetone kinase family protein n=1 Tax=Reyranella sp. TaxID=1929291 RepID=UPI003D104219